MRLTLVLTVVLVTVLLAEVNSEKPRKFKKYKKHKTTSSTTEEIPEVKEDSSELDSSDPVQMMERDEQIEEEEENKKKAEVELAESKEKIKSNNVPIHDPCATKHCGAGRVCESTPEGKAQCVCVKVCPEEADPRRKVCSNHNETWGSDCSVYQMRCWCDHNTEQCISEQYKHVHIEYYGECRQMPECTESEMADFPRRMRDWLFNIMRDLADREELTPYYLKMEREAETNMTRRWTNAAIWKWCDLDGHPHDRSVSRHELFPIRAPLLALEHCIAPFLDGCDVNNDHRISLLEWGKCLELPEDDLEDKCEELREELKDE